MWLHWVGVERKERRMFLWGLCSRFGITSHWNDLREQGEVSQMKFKAKMERKEKRSNVVSFLSFWILCTQKLRISSCWWVGLGRRNTWRSLMLKLRQSYWSLVVISLLAYILPPMDPNWWLPKGVFWIFWVVFWTECMHTQRDICLEAPEKSWPVVLPRTSWTVPGDTCIYSLALEGAELKDLSCLVALRHVRWNPALSPPHPLLDVANIGLLCSCKPVSVPHDTGGRVKCLCWSSCGSETVGARRLFPSELCLRHLKP